MVIWLIGLSASGKTTIGKELHKYLCEDKSKEWVFLDGDSIRNIMDEDLGHTKEDRYKNAYRISNLCMLLSQQGINVIACVLSIFHENQAYNRQKIIDYKEVYIDVPFNVLLKRDNKNLYSQALAGKIIDVVGVDIEFKPPISPDLILNNSQKRSNFTKFIKEISLKFNLFHNDEYQFTKNNLLKSKEKYEYTKFIGENFLSIFSENREKFLNKIEKKINQIEKNISIQSTINLHSLLDNEWSIYLSGSIFLENEYKTLIQKNSINLDNLFQFLLQVNQNFSIGEYESTFLKLVQRFEVSKRLYKSYDQEIRKKSLDLEDISGYILFGLALTKLIRTSKSSYTKVIFINALLKVDDIIISVIEDICMYSDIYLSRELISQEYQIVEKLRKELGL
jgi:cytidine diphosphoramidate kinase